MLSHWCGLAAPAAFAAATTEGMGGTKEKIQHSVTIRVKIRTCPACSTTGSAGMTVPYPHWGLLQEPPADFVPPLLEPPLSSFLQNKAWLLLMTFCCFRDRARMGCLGHPLALLLQAASHDEEMMQAGPWSSRPLLLLMRLLTYSQHVNIINGAVILLAELSWHAGVCAPVPDSSP